MYVCMFSRTLLFDWLYKLLCYRLLPFMVASWIGFPAYLKAEIITVQREGPNCVCKCVAVNLIIMFEGLNWRV